MLFFFGLSGKNLSPLKYVAKRLIFDSCVWKKFDCERKAHLVCPTNFSIEIDYRSNENFVSVCDKKKYNSSLLLLSTI
jgi:hypothetical protein